MTEDTNDDASPTQFSTHLEESAFPTNLSLFDIGTLFWSELKKILPARELHVVDPYSLDPGGEDIAVYAGNFAALLKPALVSIEDLTILFLRERDGVRGVLAEDIALINTEVSVFFRRGSEMHARYIIADRLKVLRMEFSFNRIGKSFGTISLVEDEGDRAAILNELERMCPTVEE